MSIIARVRVLHGRTFSRLLLVGTTILGLVLVATGIVVANPDTRLDIAAYLGLTSPPTIAFTIIAGHVTRIDALTGAILAQSPDLDGEQFPSMAASHDGQSLFVLRSQLQDGEDQDQLLTLSSTTLTSLASVPVQHFMRSMAAWPPALAVTPDDQTVIVSQYGRTESDPYWLSYYNRATGRFAVDSTILSGCGVSQLVPFDEQVAVVCLGSDDIRFVDVPSHKVTATLKPDMTPDGMLGSAIAAGIIPGEGALAVILDNGNLMRIDLVTHAISRITSLASPETKLASGEADFSANGHVAVLLRRGDLPNVHTLPLLIVDSTNGHILDRLSVDTSYPTVTMAPDGQRVYVLTDGGVQVVDLLTHRAQSFGPDPAATFVHLAFAYH